MRHSSKNFIVKWLRKKSLFLKSSYLAEDLLVWPEIVDIEVSQYELSNGHSYI
jgi:hypothetical protein